MTTFRHDDPSPADARWLAGRLAGCDRVEPPAADAHVLVVAAHPDDETLGAGGLMSAAHQRGAAITVVVATDGEASHPNSPTHTRNDLARRRRGEVQDAVLRLAPTAAVHFLGLPDGELEAYSEALTSQLEHFAHGATLVVCPWHGDRHPDHAACARAAARVARRAQLACWQYPIWLWHWADPDADDLPWQQLRRMPLTPHDVLAKRRAVGCHVSQHSPLSDQPGDEAIITPAMAAHFDRPFETFVVDDVPNAAEPGYFDALYSDTNDPWGLATRFYEQRKRSLLLASLPRARFRRAFEPGCAIGLITAGLAERCDAVVAWDVAESALMQTMRHLNAVSNVTVGRGAIPGDWPSGTFDLIVLSEVGYYCTDLGGLVTATWSSLEDDGVLVACHWRRPAAGHPHTAATVHDALGRGHHCIATHVEEDFVLQVWNRSGHSVATETGVLG